MYSVLGLYNKDGSISYAVSDFSREDFDIFSESELKLLVASNIKINDSDGNPVSLSNGVLSIGNVPDLTDEVSEYCDDEETEDYDIYDEDFDEDEEEEDLEDDEEEEDLEDGYGIEDLEDDEYSDYDDEEEEIEDGYDDYDIEDEEEEPEESTVSKLYSYLTEEQITVLKRYYLWYSQRLFTDAQKDPTLGIKSQTVLNRKKANLSQLRNSGGMWYYAGFVDMGYKGAGYCTLGHPLRFMHLAWDVTVSDIETAFFGEDYNANFEDAVESANCIKFGIKCISDFFEVDSECTRSLQRAQRESLKDMALMYEHYARGTNEEVCATFKFADELVTWLSKIDNRNSVMIKDYKPIINRNLSLFYHQFRKLNMIPPKSLVQEIRDHIVGWEGHVERHGHLKQPKFEVLADNFRKMFSGEFDEMSGDMSIYSFSSVTNYFITTGWKKQVLAYLYRAFMYECCGYYAYNADTNTEEGGASKGSRSEYARITENASKYFFSGVEYSLSYMSRVCRLYKFRPIDRLDERFKIPQGVVDTDNAPYMKLSETYTKPAFQLMSIYEEETGISLEKPLSVLKEVENGYRLLQYPERLVKDHEKGINFTLDEFEKLIYDNDKILRDNIEAFRQWCIDRELKNIERENNRIKEAEERRKQLQEQQKVGEEQREKEEQEHKEKAKQVKTPEDVVEYLRGSDLSKLDKSFDLPKSILNTVISSGNSPSSKQFWHIKKLYEEVSGEKFEGNVSVADKVNLDDRQDLVKVVEYVREHKTEFSTIICNICDSVFKYRSISEKQMKFIEEASKQIK